MPIRQVSGVKAAKSGYEEITVRCYPHSLIESGTRRSGFHFPTACQYVSCFQEAARVLLIRRSAGRKKREKQIE
jgi:hypothetical protein